MKTTVLVVAGFLSLTAGVLLLLVSSPDYPLVFGISEIAHLASLASFALLARESAGLLKMSWLVMSLISLILAFYTAGLLMTS